VYIASIQTNIFNAISLHVENINNKREINIMNTPKRILDNKEQFKKKIIGFVLIFEL